MTLTGMYHNFLVAYEETFTVPESNFAICLQEGESGSLYYSADGQHFNQWTANALIPGTNIVVNAPKNMQYYIKNIASNAVIQY